MWKLSPAQRLDRWKALRSQMSGTDLVSALNICSEFWAAAPYAPWYLEPDEINNWPDPWTLINDNYYCPLAKALGILYTIHLSDHGPRVNLELRRYQNKEDRTIHNLVWIDDGKYVLNSDDIGVLNNTHITSEYNMIVNISSTELKLDRY